MAYAHVKFDVATGTASADLEEREEDQQEMKKSTYKVAEDSLEHRRHTFPVNVTDSAERGQRHRDQIALETDCTLGEGRHVLRILAKFKVAAAYEVEVWHESVQRLSRLFPFSCCCFLPLELACKGQVDDSTLCTLTRNELCHS